MKRFVLCLLSILIAAFTLASCDSSEENGASKNYETITLNVYNWGEYISDGFQGSLDTNAAFEEYFNTKLAGTEKYPFRVKVNYTTYATNEDMYSKLASGAGNYDIVVPSDYMIQRMIKENMLLPFNTSELENYKNISPEFKNAYYDPTNSYSVPYTYGMIGVIYNTAFVDEEDVADKSWGLLWNEKYKGKILQFNNPRDAFGTAMYYTGLDINSTEESVWNEALNSLIAQKPLLQGYVNDEIFNKMTTASAAVAPYYAGDYISMADQNEDLAFYYPKEGTNYFVDAMCIPKNSRYPEVAKEYINYMLSEEPAVANAIYIGYASPNTVVQSSPDYQEEMGEEAMDILYGVSPAVANAAYTAMYDTACYKFVPEIQPHMNTLWESLKTENATELWIHIATGVIVGGVLALAVYTTYTKKKRSRDYRNRDKMAAKAKNANKT